MKRNGYVTSLDGYKEFNPPIIRISARVAEIIEDGNPIEKKTIKTANSHYVKYIYNGSRHYESPNC